MCYNHIVEVQIKKKKNRYYSTYIEYDHSILDYIYYINI